ncbi:MAG: DUF1772 domain-containing protein [Bacteroidota bacterium]
MSHRLIQLITLALSGLIAGTFFYGTFCVLPAFYEVPSTIHLGFRTTLMQHNKFLVMLLVILAIGFNFIYYINIRKTGKAGIACLLALICTLVSLVVTRFGSVPINILMKTWDTSLPPADWLIILKKWDLYNAIRTTTSIVGFILLMLANEIQFHRNHIQNGHQPLCSRS